MKILLQTNRRNETQLLKEYNKLVESGFDVVPFGYIKKENVISITGLEHISEEEQTYTRVCIPVLRDLFIKGLKCDRVGFSNTIQYNARSFRLDSLPISEELMNKTPNKFESSFVLDVLDKVFDQNVFMKPNDDLKLFSGTIVPQGQTLRETLLQKNELNYVLEHIASAVHCSSNLLDIEEEVRCYVVNKKVITISKYKSTIDTELHIKQSEPYFEYAQNIINSVYAPSDNFTIDIAKLKNGSFKTIEYNCLTSSGLYNCDSKKLFTALKEYYY